MAILSVVLLPLLAALAASKKCMNATVPVDVSARNGVFGKIPVPQTNPEATAFIQSLLQQGRNYTAMGLTGYQTINKTYHISAQFCTPDVENGNNPTVQVLTHGIGFDRTYWDLPYNSFNYSYIEAATKANYCTLSFDRLGVGNSSHGEPRDEVQAFLEVAALYELTMMLREGRYPGVPRAFRKIVHVGHSFGSAQTYALANMYPNASDAIVLTGFSLNATFMGYFLAGGNFMQANLALPQRFGAMAPAGQSLPSGYLVSGNAAADQLLFLLPPYYDPGIADLAEKTKQSVTLGELLTIGSGPQMNQYTGPVLIFTGDADVPFCGGDCMATGDPSLPSIPAAAKKAFPHAKCFEAYIQPRTAHGLTLHYNATAGYQVIQNFIGSKGLAAS